MFISGNIPPNNIMPSGIKSYHSEKEEMADITNHVNELIQKNIDPGKIAVVCVSSASCEQLEQHFKIKKIPFYTNRQVNILEHPFTNKIIHLLRYISSEHDMPFSGDDLLFEILHADLFEIPAVEIAKLAIEVHKKKGINTIHNIRKLLQQKVSEPAKDLFDTGINTELKHISLVLEKLISAVPHTGLQQLFGNITGIAEIQNYITRGDEGEWLLQLLISLTGFVETEIIRNPKLQLSELISMIDKMEKERIPVIVNKTIGCVANVHLLEVTTDEEMKFDYIFFAGGDASKKETHRPHDVYNIPEINFSGLPNNDIERRLDVLDYDSYTKYTAHLFISFVKYGSKEKELPLPSWIKKNLSDPYLTIEHVELKDAELEAYSVLHKILLPEIKQVDEEIVAPILRKFVMNVSALNNYLNCPLGFYYKNIIRIPSRKNEAMEFGSAVHYSLEKLFKNIAFGSSYNAQGSRFVEFTSSMELVDHFKQYLQSRRAHFTKEAFERRMEYGAKVLHNYYKHYAHRWNKVISIERNITGIINSVPVKGKLDKLEFNGNEVTIVDYKTGNIEKALIKMKPPDDDNPNGGDYWRQAVFYKMLVDNYEQKDWKVVGTEFDFIEPDKDNLYRKEKIEIAAPDTETVKQQIGEVWTKIQRREFYTGCGRQDCHWCNFVKNNNPAIYRPITANGTTTD